MNKHGGGKRPSHFVPLRNGPYEAELCMGLSGAVLGLHHCSTPHSAQSWFLPLSHSNDYPACQALSHCLLLENQPTTGSIWDHLCQQNVKTQLLSEYITTNKSAWRSLWWGQKRTIHDIYCLTITKFLTTLPERVVGYFLLFQTFTYKMRIVEKFSRFEKCG